MGRLIWGLSILLLAGTCLAADPFNVDFTIGWDNAVRSNQWTPVEVGITTNLKEPFGGTILVETQQDDLHKLIVSHPFVVTDKAPARINLVTKRAFLDSPVNLTIVDDHGKVRWRNDYQSWYMGPQANATRIIPRSDLLLGLSGKRGFGIMALDQHLQSEYRGQDIDYYNSSGRSGRAVHVQDRLPAALPWDWTGYESLDALVLYDLEWGSLHPQQVKAITEWVARGGKLLMILGGNSLPANSPLRTLLPVRIGDLTTVKVSSPGLARSFSEATEVSLHAWTLEIADEALCEVEGYGGKPLLVSGPSGFGFVELMAFDPSELEGFSPSQSAARWGAWLTPLVSLHKLSAIETAVPTGNSNNSYNNGSYQQNQPDNDQRAILAFLQDIPQLRPLSIGWILLLLLTLAVLLGPVDYFVLKRLDRLPWTWITSSGIVLIFTVGAYYGVQALRAGNLQMRFVTGIDAIQGGPAFETAYYGIFAPSSDDYAIKGLGGAQWWSGFTYSSYSYYGAHAAARSIYCQQRDGMNVPSPIAINIWSMQNLMMEGKPTQVPLRATLKDGGLEVANLSSSPITALYVLTPLGLLPTQSVGPGQTVALPYPLSKSKTPVKLDAQYSSQDWILRTGAFARHKDAINSYLEKGACVILASFSQATPEHTIDNQPCENTGIQWVRLVVLPNKGSSHD